MEALKLVEKDIIKILGILAMLLVVQTANSACIWVAHQPKFPPAANKFKRM